MSLRHRLPIRRFLAGIAAGLLGSVLLGSTALADPPGPTDYQTEVVSIEPPADIEITLRYAEEGRHSVLLAHSPTGQRLLDALSDKH